MQLSDATKVVGLLLPQKYLTRMHLINFSVMPAHAVQRCLSLSVRCYFQ